MINESKKDLIKSWVSNNPSNKKEIKDTVNTFISLNKTNSIPKGVDDLSHWVDTDFTSFKDFVYNCVQKHIDQENNKKIIKEQKQNITIIFKSHNIQIYLPLTKLAAIAVGWSDGRCRWSLCSRNKNYFNYYIYTQQKTEYIAFLNDTKIVIEVSKDGNMEIWDDSNNIQPYSKYADLLSDVGIHHSIFKSITYPPPKLMDDGIPNFGWEPK